MVQATYNNGSTDENFTDYTVDKTGSLTMSDTVITLTANENAEIQTMLNITVDKADVINSGGSATVAYTGASYDLEMIDGLFTVDPNAGAVIFTSTDWPKALFTSASTLISSSGLKSSLLTSVTIITGTEGVGVLLPESPELPPEPPLPLPGTPGCASLFTVSVAVTLVPIP